MSQFKWAILTMAVAVLSICSCANQNEEDDKRSECTRMRDHLVDLRLGEYSNIKDGSGTPIDVSGHRAAMTSALGNSFIAECVDKMTITELHCAKTASTVSALSECSTSQTGGK